nr:hypothetical protein [Rodentibacter heylii]
MTACNDSDITGIYLNPSEKNITIDKEGERYILNTMVMAKSMISGRESLTSYKVVSYKKDNALYNIADNTIVGTFNKSELTLTKNGKTYIKK